MFRVGIVLALGAVVSVLALGGVETLAFAPAQVAVVVLATVTFWRRGYPSVSRLTGFILCGLLLIPLLQLVPLPRPWVAVISSSRVRLAEAFLVPIGSLPGNLALSVSSYETRLALLKLICYLLVFLLAVEVYWSRGKALGLVGVLVSIGVFEAVYGGVQYLTGWQCIFQDARWVPVTEASGTYVNRNHFAGLLEMVVPFLLAEILFVRWAAGSSRRSAWIDLVVSPLSSRLLLNIGLFALLCIGLVFSRSRMGIIAGAVGVLTVGVIAFLQTRRRSVLLVLLLILSVPGAYSIWIGLNPVIERFEVLGRPGALEEDRLPVWRDTVTLIRDYPVAGTGLGTHRWANQHYQTAKFSGSYEHAHNDYLEFASEIGIPGAVLLFGGLWALVIRVAQRALVLERASRENPCGGVCGSDDGDLDARDHGLQSADSSKCVYFLLDGGHRCGSAPPAEPDPFGEGSEPSGEPSLNPADWGRRAVNTLVMPPYAALAALERVLQKATASILPYPGAAAQRRPGLSEERSYWGLVNQGSHS